MDITAASTERTIHIRICHRLWFRAFNMYIFKIPGFYECPISWVHFTQLFSQSTFSHVLKPLIHTAPQIAWIFLPFFRDYDKDH